MISVVLEINGGRRHNRQLEGTPLLATGGLCSASPDVGRSIALLEDIRTSIIIQESRQMGCFRFNRGVFLSYPAP